MRTNRTGHPAGTSPNCVVAPTDEGWAYLAVILDLFSRSVVGWALDATLAAPLPLAALGSALKRRCPNAALMFHSDQGCQYASAQHREVPCPAGDQP